METDTMKSLDKTLLATEHDALGSATQQHMKGKGHSLTDALKRKTVLTTKNVTKTGCWNVRTLYEPSRRVQLIKEMKRYSIDILRVSETR